MTDVAYGSGETKWADIDADEDFEPSFRSTSGMTGFETKPDKNGIKTVTNYTKNAKGQTIKIVKKVKVTRKHQRINKAVYDRMENMKKFGLELSNESGAEAYTVRAYEDFHIEVPKYSKLAKMKIDDEDDYNFADLHIHRPTRDLKLKFKSLRDDNYLNDEDKNEDADEREGRYVPPAKRMGNDGDSRSMEQQQKEECTVRVTNLSEDVKETDLTELFGSAGKIHRIYLAKHKETKYSKGFAFITYTHKHEAARAIEKLNRHGYDNLLLNVEWAKPSNRERN